MSHHLAVLRQAGLATDRREGKRVLVIEQVGFLVTLRVLPAECENGEPPSDPRDAAQQAAGSDSRQTATLQVNAWEQVTSFIRCLPRVFAQHVLSVVRQSSHRLPSLPLKELTTRAVTVDRALGVRSLDMATIRLKEEPATPLVLILNDGPAKSTVDGDERQDARRAGGEATLPRPQAWAARKLWAKNGADDCSGCGVGLLPGEMAFVWENAVVCGKCFQRRQAAHILAAVVARRMPGLAIVAEVATNGRPSWSYAARRFLRRPIKTTARILRS